MLVLATFWIPPWLQNYCYPATINRMFQIVLCYTVPCKPVFGSTVVLGNFGVCT